MLPRLSIDKGRSRINVGGFLEVEVVLENVGQGPAVDVQFLAAISSIDPGPRPDFEIDPKGLRKEIAPVAPGMQSPAPRRVGAPQAGMHSIIFSGDDIDEDVQVVVDGKSQRERVFAVVRFSSVTGTRFETRKSEAGIEVTEKLREARSRWRAFRRAKR